MTSRQNLILQQIHRRIIAAKSLLGTRHAPHAEVDLNEALQMIEELRYGPTPANRRAVDHVKALVAANNRQAVIAERERRQKAASYQRQKQKKNTEPIEDP